jgi:ferredoxin
MGYGIVHARASEFSEALEIMKTAVGLGGLSCGEHGIGLLKKEFAEKKWLLELKKKYDPNNILNPGKVVGPGKTPTPEKLSVCAACGICRGRCPVFKVVLDEAASPRGKALMLEKGVIDDLYRMCTLCKACEVECPMGAKFIDDVRLMREKMVAEGRESQANKKMIDNIRKYGNPFGKLEKGETPKDLYCC